MNRKKTILDSLSNDVILLILRHLDFKSLVKTDLVSKQWRMYCLDLSLWFFMFKTEFPLITLPKKSIDWRSLFKLHSNWKNGRSNESILIKTPTTTLNKPANFWERSSSGLWIRPDGKKDTPFSHPMVLVFKNLLFVCSKEPISEISGYDISNKCLIDTFLIDSFCRGADGLVVTSMSLDLEVQLNGCKFIVGFNTGDFSIISFQNHKFNEVFSTLHSTTTTNTSPIIAISCFDNFIVYLTSNFDLFILSINQKLKNNQTTNIATLKSFICKTPVHIFLEKTQPTNTVDTNHTSPSHPSSSMRMILSYSHEVGLINPSISIGIQEFIFTSTTLIQNNVIEPSKKCYLQQKNHHHHNSNCHLLSHSSDLSNTPVTSIFFANSYLIAAHYDLSLHVYRLTSIDSQNTRRRLVHVDSFFGTSKPILSLWLNSETKYITGAGFGGVSIWPIDGGKREEGVMMKKIDKFADDERCFRVVGVDAYRIITMVYSGDGGGGEIRVFSFQ